MVIPKWISLPSQLFSPRPFDDALEVGAWDELEYLPEKTA